MRISDWSSDVCSSDLWNTRYRGVKDQFLLEHAVLDIGVGMKWLKEEAGVEAIVILGNSGGGSLMGAYQAEAIAPTLTDRLPPVGQDALASIIKGDLYISFNAHQGRPEVLTDWMEDRKSTRLNSSH